MMSIGEKWLSFRWLNIIAYTIAVLLLIIGTYEKVLVRPLRILFYGMTSTSIFFALSMIRSALQTDKRKFNIACKFALAILSVTIYIIIAINTIYKIPSKYSNIYICSVEIVAFIFFVLTGMMVASELYHRWRKNVKR